MGQPLSRVLARQEAMAHPAPSGSVPADVAEAAFVVAIRSTEADLLDGLVYNEAFGLVVHHSQPIPADVQQSSDRTTT